MALLQEGGCPPGPQSGLLCNTETGPLRRHTAADRTRGFSGKEHLDGEQEGNRTQPCHRALSLQRHGEDSLQVVSGQSFWLRVFLSGCIAPAKMDSSEEDSGRLVGHTDWCFLLPFQNCFWSRCISSLAPYQASCHKITVK